MLRPGEQRLIEVARQIGFGSLRKLIVRDGELISGPFVKTKRRLRLGKTDSGRCVRSVGEDFMLKAQHIECIERIRRITSGTVTIEVQDGLPVDLIIDEELRM
jgi:hypothetical protein